MAQAYRQVIENTLLALWLHLAVTKVIYLLVKRALFALKLDFGRIHRLSVSKQNVPLLFALYFKWLLMLFFHHNLFG